MSNGETQVHQFDLAKLTSPAGAVEDWARTFLQQRAMPTNLKSAIEYAFFGPGKRLRPVLVVRCCEAVGGDERAALPAAAAIELIHCFSLVHDDLPAMDDDDLRRGRPTLHKHTNEAMAILAGDAMTSLAFEAIASGIDDAALSRAVARELSTATTDMISGQIYDTLPAFDADTPPARRLELIHRHKTGALLRCACRMGGRCGGASAEQLNNLTHYAESVGLMFQIIDDLLDVTQSTEQLGKTANKDADQGKLTYPGVMGIDASRAEVARLRDAAHAALADLGASAEPLRELCDYMAVREK
ncbi:polyprenyl synthetase family protein [Phycisphaerales bacterium AB-hyl4]|uniref:Polyprenyl synthetase family protein n=1 Tax=Natronomicrosphaera hydrolytica TaxID=3242702 RepID=A0ABV4U0Z7_9BACT